jgi:hypothetical protein
MKLKKAFPISIFLLGLLIINSYIFWLSTQIVPFHTPLPFCSSSEFTFSANHLSSDMHTVGVFFKDNPEKPIREIQKNLRFQCKIYETKSNILSMKTCTT